jgi:hypothetical protein
LVTVRRSCATWAAPANSIQAGARGHLGDVLLDLPPALKARLFAIFDMHITWNKTGDQATVTVEIAEATLQAVTAFLDPTQDGYHDTHPTSSSDDPAPMWDPANTLDRDGTVTWVHCHRFWTVPSACASWRQP